MLTARKRVPIDNATGLTGDFADLMRALRTLVDPYRPEEHYMRGPGPKWHAKHDQPDGAMDTHPVSLLVRAKG